LVEFNGAFLLFITRLRLEFIFSQTFQRTKNRFLTLHYANNYRYNAPYHQMEQRKCENTDGTKQNNRKQEICEAGLRILRKGEVIP
ncbi:hypothetical protein T12_10958, partial [Trichinella patagoniensis]